MQQRAQPRPGLLQLGVAGGGAQRHTKAVTVQAAALVAGRHIGQLVGGFEVGVQPVQQRRLGAGAQHAAIWRAAQPQAVSVRQMPGNPAQQAGVVRHGNRLVEVGIIQQRQRSGQRRAHIGRAVGPARAAQKAVAMQAAAQVGDVAHAARCLKTATGGVHQRHAASSRQRASSGSSTPASAKPRARSWQAAHSPHGGTAP